MQATKAVNNFPNVGQTSSHQNRPMMPNPLPNNIRPQNNLGMNANLQPGSSRIIRDEPPKSFSSHVNQLRNGPSIMPPTRPVFSTFSNTHRLNNSIPIRSSRLDEESQKEEICNIIEDDISTEVRDHCPPTNQINMNISPDPNNLTENYSSESTLKTPQMSSLPLS